MAGLMRKKSYKLRGRRSMATAEDKKGRGGERNEFTHAVNALTSVKGGRK